MILLYIRGDGHPSRLRACVDVCADCMQVALLYSRLQCVVTEGEGGAGGLAGRCNAGRASGDKDSHWCQAGRVIYLVGGRGNTGSIFSLMKN